MAPITTASDETNHMALLDKLDMAKIHKPFRNPAYKAPQRRNKNLKQILSEAQRREAQSLLNTTTNNSGSATPTTSTADATLHPNPAQGSSDLSRAVLEKTLPAVPNYSYTSIAAAPSLKPKMKYCDITGLPAKYQDPKTGLRYCNGEAYGVIRTLNTAQVQEYLATRGANTVLK
ncbi:hypothetical protein MBLNU457_5839t1 [Dothideomycetes sp. NU457]